MTLGYRTFRAVVHVLWSAYFRPIVTGTQHVPSSGPVHHRAHPPLQRGLRLRDLRDAPQGVLHGEGLPLALQAPRGVHLGDGGVPCAPRGRGPRRARDGRGSARAPASRSCCSPRGRARRARSIGEIHEGASFLAARTGAPIVPVGIAGTDRAMPRGAKVPRPKKVHIVIGPAGPRAGGRRRGARVPRRVIAATTAALRAGPAGRLRRGVRPAQRSRSHVRTTTLR